MKTFYEVLEVSENASKEVIEKAYKVLAKKYHPDLQAPDSKAIAEKKMKEINEAYEILGDDEKRKAYDLELANKRNIEKQKEIQERMQEGIQNMQNGQVQYSAKNYQPQNNTRNETQQEQRYKDMQRRYEAELQKQQEKMKRKMEKDMQQQYEDAYYNYLRQLGYRIKERWTWKKTKKLILVILFLIIIGVILWYIPSTKKIMLNIYNSNIILKTIIDVIIGVISGIFKSIKSIFSGNI